MEENAWKIAQMKSCGGGWCVFWLRNNTCIAYTIHSTLHTSINRNLFILEAVFVPRFTLSSLCRPTAIAQWLEILMRFLLPFVCCYLLPFDATRYCMRAREEDRDRERDHDHKCECISLRWRDTLTAFALAGALHGMNKLSAGETDFSGDSSSSSSNNDNDFMHHSFLLLLCFYHFFPIHLLDLVVSVKHFFSIHTAFHNRKIFFFVI